MWRKIIWSILRKKKDSYLALISLLYCITSNQDFSLKNEKKLENFFYITIEILIYDKSNKITQDEKYI